MPNTSEILSRLAANLRNTVADIEALAALAAQPDAAAPIPAPEPEAVPAPAPQPEPRPVPDQPIWELTAPPRLEIPAEVIVPAGATDIYIPVRVDRTDRQSFFAVADRLINAPGGSINVGNAAASRANFDGLDVPYMWSPGDDPLHWIRISPRQRHTGGRAFQVVITVRGLDDSQRGRTVTVRFEDGAAEQRITQPFHRPRRRLDLSQAHRANRFDPASLTHSPTGAGGTWMSALSHGRAQDGNRETGLYADATIPGAVSPISHDPAERAIRLHTCGMDTPMRWDGRDWHYQAAVLQGLHRDDVCGAEGVWRMEAKIPMRRYSWPAFWLVNRVRNERTGQWENRWPGEIDILEKFNHAFGAADTPCTSSFAQHFGNLGDWQNKRGSFGMVFGIDQLGGAAAPLDEVYTSWACHVRYDPEDTTRSEVTFFVNDLEVGCHILHARHQDLNRKV